MAYTQGFAGRGTAGFGVGMEEFCLFDESFLEDGNEFRFPGCLGGGGESGVRDWRVGWKCGWRGTSRADRGTGRGTDFV